MICGTMTTGEVPIEFMIERVDKASRGMKNAPIMSDNAGKHQ